MNPKKPKYPVPTGNPWRPSEADPATVPIPLPVILKKIEGPYTERDRKLWVFLLHAAWDEIPDEDIGKTIIHDLPVSKIISVFRSLGCDHNSQWIWESVKRLARTVAEWEDDEQDGVEALLGSAITKSTQDNGRLRYYFPPLLTPKLKKAIKYARLRTHFVIQLSGKYAVTLYELLESAANLRCPIIEYSLTDLRVILKVPEGKLIRYQDLRRRVLEPSIAQINKDPVQAGFKVDMQPVKVGRAIERIRFTITKSDERKLIEDTLKQQHINYQQTYDTQIKIPALKLETYETARKLAPRWDVYLLEQQWREKIAREGMPQNADKAFIGYCRRVGNKIARI